MARIFGNMNGKATIRIKLKVISDIFPQTIENNSYRKLDRLCTSGCNSRLGKEHYIDLRFFWPGLENINKSARKTITKHRLLRLFIRCGKIESMSIAETTDIPDSLDFNDEITDELVLKLMKEDMEDLDLFVENIKRGMIYKLVLSRHGSNLQRR